MKYIRTYENLNKPKVGDYVLCEEDEIPTSSWHKRRWATENLLKVYNFISTHVGKFVCKLRDNVMDDYRYIIEYENVPEELQRYFPYEKSVKNKSKEKRYRRS